FLWGNFFLLRGFLVAFRGVFLALRGFLLAQLRFRRGLLRCLLRGHRAERPGDADARADAGPRLEAEASAGGFRALAHAREAEAAAVAVHGREARRIEPAAVVAHLEAHVRGRAPQAHLDRARPR